MNKQEMRRTGEELDSIRNLHIPQLEATIIEAITLLAVGGISVIKFKEASTKCLEEPSYSETTNLVISYVISAVELAYRELTEQREKPTQFKAALFGRTRYLLAQQSL